MGFCLLLLAQRALLRHPWYDESLPRNQPLVLHELKDNCDIDFDFKEDEGNLVLEHTFVALIMDLFICNIKY